MIARVHCYLLQSNFRHGLNFSSLLLRSPCVSELNYTISKIFTIGLLSVMSSIDTQHVCGFHLVLRANMRRVLHPALVCAFRRDADRTTVQTGLSDRMISRDIVRHRAVSRDIASPCVFDILFC